ncbi:DNA methyltransferase [Burkholderia sp. Ac-20345]|uniref:DNA-methyltransferase n=1 Tax=Burkholderia sp. Ac-20345 TaxID=2703891 RepID=UPI003217B1A4
MREGVAHCLVGDCREVLRTLGDASVDAIVTDPPYELGFMGKAWDRTGVANDVVVWAECLRVLKPGGHLLAFSGSRTYHRMACAIEDAGFEIRDRVRFECSPDTKYGPLWESLNAEQRGALLELLNEQIGLGSELAWEYGSGFPKSLDVSKAIDKAAGAEREVLAEGKAVKRMIPGADQNATGSWIKDNGREYVPTVTAPATDAARQWDGWGTALKPAHEPIVVARKPLEGTVAANVLQHGVGGLNIDACRVPSGESTVRSRTENDFGLVNDDGWTPTPGTNGSESGRWPANVIHDGSREVLDEYATFGERGAAAPVHRRGSDKFRSTYGAFAGNVDEHGSTFHGDAGSAARFFYCAKASRADRNEGVGGSDAPAVETNATMRERENADWPARNGNHHPTVKPTELMAYLVRLVTPPGGTVLDPFMGSGSTGKAAMREGFRFIGVDVMPEYAAIARARIQHEWQRQEALRARPVQLDLLVDAGSATARAPSELPTVGTRPPPRTPIVLSDDELPY